MYITVRCEKCNAILSADFGPFNDGWNLFVRPCASCCQSYRTIVGRDKAIGAIEGLILRGDVAYFTFDRSDGALRHLRGRPINWKENRYGRYDNILVAEIPDDGADDESCIRTICLERLRSIDFGGVRYEVQL